MKVKLNIAERIRIQNILRQQKSPDGDMEELLDFHKKANQFKITDMEKKTINWRISTQMTAQGPTEVGIWDDDKDIEQEFEIENDVIKMFVEATKKFVKEQKISAADMILMELYDKFIKLQK